MLRCNPAVFDGQLQVFAICAMRSIYTLVQHAISDLPYLKPAVALVLGFVGAKMFAEFFHYEVSIGVSLSVVRHNFIFNLGLLHRQRLLNGRTRRVRDYSAVNVEPFAKAS